MTRRRESNLLKLLLYAYPDRVTARRPGDPSRGVMVGGRGVVLDPSSIVRNAPLFLSVDPRDTSADAGESRVSMASEIEEEWLSEVHPHLVDRSVVHSFDESRARVVSLRQTRFAGLLIREDPVGAQVDPEGAARALREWLLQDPEGLFARYEAARHFLARIRFLRRFAPELDLPHFNRALCGTILAQAGEGCISLDKALGKKPERLLESRLTWKQRTALEEHAPERIEVPSGSRIRLDYPGEPGAPPVLAVRLQELFGWNESPRIAKGRVPVLLHLLGPNFRPVQVTSDLKSFWETAYGDVRKDLRARYPRHPWPENPWNARPIAVGGKRKR